MAMARIGHNNNNNFFADAILLLLFASLAYNPVYYAAATTDVDVAAISVLDHGVEAGATGDSAENFEKAWKAACKAGSRLVIPEGEYMASAMVFTGPCGDDMTVELKGTLKAIADLDKYSNDAWITFKDVKGLTLTGGGIVDGNGWKHKTAESNLPSSIKFIHSKNINVEDISSVDSMGFHFDVVLCKVVKFTNVKIEAPRTSSDTEGIHLNQTTEVHISDTTIKTGGDCIGVMHGCTDVLVEKVTCSSGHGFSIGSLGKHEDEQPVKRVVISNSVMKNTENGLGIKTFAGSPMGSCSEITFQDITVENVKNPIFINQAYGDRSKTPSMVRLSEIKFINIKGSSASETAVNVKCSQEVPCERVELSDINLQFQGGESKSSCRNAKITYLGDHFPARCL